MKNLLSFALLLVTAFCHPIATSAQSDYSAAKILSPLPENADLVVRRHEVIFQVLNKGEAIETEHQVLTLLNDRAAKANEQVFFYSKINDIEDIEGTIYDGSGQVVRHLKKKDIADEKPFQYEFVDDYRCKILRFPRRPFPYTIEFTVTRHYHGLLHYPVFEPQSEARQSVEYARFEVKLPPGLTARFHETNVPAESKVGPWVWEFRNLTAFETEPFAPVEALTGPRVMTAPNAFRLGDFEGDMSTWQSFGMFLQKLNAGQEALPPQVVSALHQLTADCPDAACKIQRIYEQLQNSTRYFFVGLGIGGWQPEAAGDVDTHKYGDCKGLSNYTVAMLRAVGIPAYYALIRATPEAQATQTPDFPNAWFNHAIACVPMEHDTLWLECTSQTESCGFLSDFTDNRPALVVFPDGGRLLQTPKYDQTTNTIRRQADLLLAVDGSATLTATDTYCGIAQSIPAALAELPDERRRKYLYERLSLPDFAIRSLTFERKKARLPEVRQTLRLDIPRLAAVSGKRLFLPVSLLSTKVNLPPTSPTPRRFPVQAHPRGLTEQDSVTVTLPEGFRLENAPAPVAFASAFGSFEMAVAVENGRLVIRRRLILTPSIQPAERYGELIEFLGRVGKADRGRLVLVR